MKLTQATHFVLYQPLLSIKFVLSPHYRAMITPNRDRFIDKPVSSSDG